MTSLTSTDHGVALGSRHGRSRAFALAYSLYGFDYGPSDRAGPAHGIDLLASAIHRARRQSVGAGPHHLGTVRGVRRVVPRRQYRGHQAGPRAPSAIAAPE